MESSAKFSQKATQLSELPPEILLCIASFAAPESCFAIVQTCHVLHSLAYSRTFWIDLIRNIRLRRPLLVDETVDDIRALQVAALRALRLHNKWASQSDYPPSHWRILSPPNPFSTDEFDTSFPNMFVWFADEGTLVQVIGGMIYWRDGRTGAAITSFHTKHTLLFGDTCLIHGELFMAVELENDPEEHSRTLVEIWRSHYPEGPVWEMEVASQLGLVIYKQHAIFLVRDTPMFLSATIVSLLDMEEWIVPIHFEVEEGSTETTCDIANEQFIFHYSVDEITPIYFLPHETLLAQRTRDRTGSEVSPKEVLRLNYFDGTIDQEMWWVRRVYPSWDGRRVVLWRTQTTLYDGPRLIAHVHDISESESGPLEVSITPIPPFPDEDILIDAPLDILVDHGGFRIQHGGFSGKATAWLTNEFTLMLLEIPPLDGQGASREKEKTRSWRIPSSVGLEHHGDVMDLWLDDARGRAILAMQDETLIIFEFV